MNPADADAIREELRAQANALQRHDELVTSISGGLREMAARHERGLGSIHELLQRLSLSDRGPDPASPVSPPVRTPPVSDTRLPPLERYSGVPGSCRPFLVQCSLAFELQPSAFPTERSQVVYIVSLLAGRARDWGTAELEKESAICSSVKLFSDELRKVFDHVTHGREVALGLFNLAQGGRSVSDYSIQFRTVAAESNWNAASLFDAFYNDLSDDIKDELAARDLPADLDALVSLSIRIDSRMREQRREKVWSAASPVRVNQPFHPPGRPSEQRTNAHCDAPEPMQLGRTQLSTAERQRHLKENRCLYCGQDGHFVSSCPVKDMAHQSSRGRW